MEIAKLFLSPAARGPHGMGDLLSPSGLLKASLNELKRQQMQQSIECHVIGEMLYAHWVSKPSNFLNSYLLSPQALPQKLLIKIKGEL